MVGVVVEAVEAVDVVEVAEGGGDVMGRLAGADTTVERVVACIAVVSACAPIGRPRLARAKMLNSKRWSMIVVVGLRLEVQDLEGCAAAWPQLLYTRWNFKAKTLGWKTTTQTMCPVLQYALIHVANLSGFYPNKYEHPRSVCAHERGLACKKNKSS
jgi:hypothetical protein